MLAVSDKRLLQCIIMFAYGNVFLSQPFSAVNNMPPVKSLQKHVCLVEHYFKYKPARKCHRKFHCQLPRAPLQGTQSDL